jgi:hypothetical protein
MNAVSLYPSEAQLMHSFMVPATAATSSIFCNASYPAD